MHIYSASQVPSSRQEPKFFFTKKMKKMTHVVLGALLYNFYDIMVYNYLFVVDLSEVLASQPAVPDKVVAASTEERMYT